MIHEGIAIYVHVASLFSGTQLYIDLHNNYYVAMVRMFEAVLFNIAVRSVFLGGISPFPFI